MRGNRQTEQLSFNNTLLFLVRTPTSPWLGISPNKGLIHNMIYIRGSQHSEQTTQPTFLRKPKRIQYDNNTIRLLQITHLASRKSYLVITGPHSHGKLTIFKLGQVGVDLNIAQNHLFNPKEVISGHYLSQFTGKIDHK